MLLKCLPYINYNYYKFPFTWRRFYYGKYCIAKKMFENRIVASYEYYFIEKSQ